MNGNSKRAKKPMQVIRVWTFEEIKQALPYVASIMRSLREAYLDANRSRLAAARLAKRPGRPSRSAMIAHEEAGREARLAGERFEAALGELHAVDVFCVDPLQGLAMVPFLRDEQLAWFLFDLFDSEPIRFWRYHTDPLETRRPIGEDGDRLTETRPVG